MHHMEVSAIKKVSSWVKDELNGINIGDARLNERAKVMLNALGSKPTESIPNALYNGWPELKAAYRFFDNEKVTAEKILSPHKKATIERIKQEKIILVPQDTTVFHFKNVDGIGPLGNKGETGFLNHVAMAVTPNGVNLGILSSKFWARKELGKKAQRKQKSIEEKESYRWLEGLWLADEIAKLASETKVISVADREGDIYELYTELSKLEGKKAHYLVRVSHNRNLEDEKNDENKIWNNVSQAAPLGKIKIQAPRNATRKSREVILTLRTSRVTLSAPYRIHEKLSPVEMSVILAEEETPSKEEKPIQWLLLTDLEVNTLEEATEKLNWYVTRWTIEVYFRILKTGCRIEELQLEDFKRLQVCLSLYMIVAWRIQMLIKLGKEFPDLPCNILFDECEWKSAYIVHFKKKPPKKVPSLEEMCRIVAMFGGFIGRKSDGFPGAQTLWIGLQRVKDFGIALGVAKAI